MKIEVGFPRRSFMHNNTPANSLVLLASIPSVEVDIYIHNESDNDNITHSTPHLKLVYQEKLDMQASFEEVSERAMQWAKTELKNFITNASWGTCECLIVIYFSNFARSLSIAPLERESTFLLIKPASFFFASSGSLDSDIKNSIIDRFIAWFKQTFWYKKVSSWVKFILFNMFI
nr:hypothetical protein [Providencia stuartii]